LAPRGSPRLTPCAILFRDAPRARAGAGAGVEFWQANAQSGYRLARILHSLLKPEPAQLVKYPRQDQTAMTSPATDYYFRRFGFCERRIATAPRSDLGIVVVIPCFDEPDLVGSLESLWNCERLGCS